MDASAKTKRHSAARLAAVLVSCLMATLGFIGKGPATVSDGDIEAAIKQRLTMDGRIHSKGIEIKVEKGTVTLSGMVETIEERSLIDNLVASTYGVKAVVNHVIVRPPVNRDDQIAKAVKETFKTVPALENKDIQVNVSDGVATLKGTVETEMHRKAAERAAETVPGVVKVVNLIKVDKPRPDREIENDAVFYLKSSSIVNLDDVDVSVENGKVILKGTIDNFSHKFTVLRDIEKIPGVREVDAAGLTVRKT